MIWNSRALSLFGLLGMSLVENSDYWPIYEEKVEYEWVCWSYPIHCKWTSGLWTLLLSLVSVSWVVCARQCGGQFLCVFVGSPAKSIVGEPLKLRSDQAWGWRMYFFRLCLHGSGGDLCSAYSSFLHLLTVGRLFSSVVVLFCVSGVNSSLLFSYPKKLW